MIALVVVLVFAILLVLLVNESGVDATTARVLRIIIIAGAIIFALVRVGGLG